MENILVYGDSSKDLPVGIIVPAKNEIMNWAKSKGFSSSHFETICEKKETQQVILDSLKEIGKKEGLKSFELLSNIYVCPDEWTPENDMVTAAQKIKRQQIIAKYKTQLQKL